MKRDINTFTISPLARGRLALALWLGVSGYVWFQYPQVMAFMLVCAGVFVLLTLAVALMMRFAKRGPKPETREQRSLRLVNDGATHHWRRVR